MKTKIEDLSKDLLLKYKSALSELGRDDAWGQTALGMKSLEEWEKWGFGLFYTDRFQKQVNQALTLTSGVSVEQIKLMLDADREEYMAAIRELNQKYLDLAKYVGYITDDDIEKDEVETEYNF